MTGSACCVSFAGRELDDQRIQISSGWCATGRCGSSSVAAFLGILVVPLAESMTMTLLDQANSGEVQDSGESFAVAYLAVLGLTPADGARVVDEARHWLREHPDVPKS
ncbi:hypothetical protein RHA1_ro01243 [Rhodococcus jostii RHA1]|uniref:Uncharacterized protein n=1 Tax=Rhodococcus jostii (strain RHA1) TaxID=101510 RepID=Q0SHB9_RHOJR|nr:hypothetical protein [Rhodococcus jostii]ABG93067.1 hypothetical protein RHA1_ro01243 [Rhodococcus jostii RHA1]